MHQAARFFGGKCCEVVITRHSREKIEYPMKMYSMHQRDSSPAAKIPTLYAWQASLSISEWGMRSGFDEQARRAPSSRLRKYDARCCIIFTEGYRSGHNEAVLKTVCRQARGFESHSLRQNPKTLENTTFSRVFCFLMIFSKCALIFSYLKIFLKGFENLQYFIQFLFWVF